MICLRKKPLFTHSVPVSQVFDDLTLSTKPVAAASLGQVYRLQLKNDSGNTVAVKVQARQFLKFKFS
jgi:predicted unusual protein kinase regulating ubiquinone biosynthesis (AarF/ABC1/UbiB family)